jgi:hypothetical protein
VNDNAIAKNRFDLSQLSLFENSTSIISIITSSLPVLMDQLVVSLSVCLKK